MKNKRKTKYNFLYNRQQEIIICLVLITAMLLVYGQLTRHEFINFDDGDYVTENTHVQAGFTLESIKWAFTTGHAANWHPLTWLSHMLDYELYGLNPMGHHWTNLLFHMANTLLLFFLLQKMTGAMWKSAFVAALFALHPLHVESVAWVSERKDVLSTFLGFLAIWAYIRYVSQRNFFWYFMVFFLLSLGLMAKPMLVTLPFVLLLLDFWPLSRFQSTGQDDRRFNIKVCSALVLEKLPLFALSAVSCSVTFLVQKYGSAVVPLEIFPLKLRIANASISYVSYLGKTLWPHNLALFYPYAKFLSLDRTIMSGSLLLFFSALVFFGINRFPYLATGWLWYLGTLVPVIGLVQVGSQTMADRYTYIPLVGIFIAVVWGAADVSARWRNRKGWLSLISISLLVPILICTWFQTRYWKNSKTIFTHTLNVTKNNSVAHFHLGLAFDKLGKPSEAVLHYRQALKIDPDYAIAHHNLGVVLAKEGKINAAIYHYGQALKIDSNYSKAYYNLAKAYMALGEIQTAVQSLQEALRINPNMEVALFNLSWIYATSENERNRNGRKAVVLAEKLCKLTEYKQPLAFDALAAAYAEAGKYDDAVFTAEKALERVLMYGPETRVSGIKKRLNLYKSHQPYRQASQ